MATLNINGKRVKVDDSFLELSPEQQEATVNEIASSLGADKPEAPENNRALEAAGVASGGFIEGIPVVGPYIRKALDYPAAAGAMMLADRPVTFAEALQAVRGEQKVQSEKHPYIDAGSKVAGAVAGTAPMIMAAPAAFGAGSAGIGARSLASGLSGLALGAADTGVRSDFDPEAMGWGAAIGAGTGLVGPAAGQMIGAGIRKGASAVTNWRAARDAGLPASALSKLNQAATRDGIQGSVLDQRLAELGPEAMIMDLGPNLQRQAGALAALPGEAQEIVRGAVNQRQAGANQRILSELDETLGPVRSPVQINETIRAGQRDVAPAYEEAFRGAMPVQTGYIADMLDNQVVALRGPAQKAARQVREMLNLTGKNSLDTNPYTLFQTRNAIDGMLVNEDNPQVIRVLSMAREEIDKNLARNVPNIKMADAQFQELARQNEGLRRGTQVLDSGKTSPRPEDFAQEVEAGVIPEGLMVGPSGQTFRISQAARAEIDRILGTKANDIVGLNQAIKGDGDWNRAKLVSLFGKEKTDKVIAVLDREKTFAKTRHIVDQNSETAARSAAMEDLASAQTGGMGSRDGYIAGGILGAGRSLAVKAGEKAMNVLAGAGAEVRNKAMAEALASRRQAIIDALMRVQEPNRLSTKEIEALSRALITGGGLSAGR